MKKLFKKKQFILAVLTVMLAAAIYVNWQFSGSGSGGVASSDVDKNLGQAEYVGNQDVEISDEEEQTDTYFSNARKDREAAREEALDELEEIQSDIKAEEVDISTAINEQVRIAAAMETEANIESLVKAKGFKDCVAVVNDESINVVVLSDALDSSEILQIQDVVLSQKKIDLENIKIINVE